MTQSTVNKLRERHLLFYILNKQFSGHQCAVWIHGPISMWSLSFPFLLEIRLTESLFTREYHRRGAWSGLKDTFFFLLTALLTTLGMFRAAASTGLNSVRWSFCTDAHRHGNLSNKQLEAVGKVTQTFTFTQCRDPFFIIIIFCVSTTVYISCAISLQKKILVTI